MTMKIALLILSLALATISQAAPELVRPRVWLKTVAATNTPEIITQSSATATRLSTYAVKLSWSAATNYYRVGDNIVVSASTDSTYNGSFIVSAVGGGIATNTWVIYTNITAIANASGGSVTNYARLRFKHMTMMGKKSKLENNSATLFFGPSEVDSYQLFPLDAGGEVIVESPAGDYFLTSDLYADVQAAGDGLILFFY